MTQHLHLVIQCIALITPKTPVAMGILAYTTVG